MISLYILISILERNNVYKEQVVFVLMDDEEKSSKTKISDIKKAVKGEEKEVRITDLPGIGPSSAKKLEDAGIYDLMGVAVMSPSSLSEVAGVGEAVARKAIQAARKMMDLGF